MIRETHALLFHRALESNYTFLKSLVPEEAFFCPMIKCNAYGHGDGAVAKQLETWGCAQVGVVSVEEGMALRGLGVRMDVLVFGYVSVRGWKEIEEARLVPVISSLRELREMRDSGAACQFHLKFNTGMNRLGIRKEDWPEVRKTLRELRKSKMVGLCSHLIQASDIASGKRSSNQILQFEEILREFSSEELHTHMLNSTGLFQVAQHFPDKLSVLGARPGLALYGVSTPEQGPLARNLDPVMSFRSKVVQVQNVSKGEVVSYDGVWSAGQNSKIGIVPAGYGDGIPWNLVGKGRVHLGDTEVPMVGRICMDHFMVDLTERVSETSVFKEDVEIFGKRQSVQDLAQQAGTIPYELLTRVNQRVPRLWERSPTK